MTETETAVESVSDNALEKIISGKADEDVYCLVISDDDYWIIDMSSKDFRVEFKRGFPDTPLKFYIAIIKSLLPGSKYPKKIGQDDELFEEFADKADEILICLKLDDSYIDADVDDLTWFIIEYDDIADILDTYDIDHRECKYPTCSRPRRTRGMSEYDGNYSVSVYGAKFCSTKHELKYDHIKADAEDARRAERENQSTKSNRSCR